MSSYIKYVNDGDKKTLCDCEQDTAFAKCDDRLSPCPKKILDECGISGGETTFTSTDIPAEILASVDVDISCFKKPQIKLEFSSQVTFEGPLDLNLSTTIDSEVVLDYTLVSSQNGSEIDIGTWTYSRLFPAGTVQVIAGVPITTTDTFSFNKCICEPVCPGCITYFVRVEARVVSQGQDPVLMQMIPNARATVFQGEIAASVQEM